jgi:hypothetical protein
MIDNTEEFLLAIKIRDEISLENAFIYSDRPIIIDKDIVIIGTNSILQSTIIVNSNVSFYNLKFQGYAPIILIANNCTVEFFNCSFNCFNDFSAIHISNNYNRNVIINNCTFSKISTPLNLNDNYIVVKDSNELISALNSCSSYSTLYLMNGYYLGNISIEKPLSIIGDSKTIIIPNNKLERQSGFIINSSNVILKNLIIDGGTLYKFQDGVKFEEDGGFECKFVNLQILRAERRGISLWGKNTNNTLISGCLFKNIIAQCGVHTWNYTKVNNCFFYNINIGLTTRCFKDLEIMNNHFENLNLFLESFNTTSDNKILKYNSFKSVKKLI